jgi:hypothetical protein
MAGEIALQSKPNDGFGVDRIAKMIAELEPEHERALEDERERAMGDDDGDHGGGGYSEDEDEEEDGNGSGSDGGSVNGVRSSSSRAPLPRTSPRNKARRRADAGAVVSARPRTNAGTGAVSRISRYHVDGDSLSSSSSDDESSLSSEDVDEEDAEEWRQRKRQKIS